MAEKKTPFDRPEGTPPREDCVRHIVELMVQGRFRMHLTQKELAQKWGLADSTVYDYAREASRFLKIPKEKREEYQAVQAAFLDAVMHDALNRHSVITGLPDYRHVILAWEMFQKYVLANNPLRPESDGPSPGEMSDEDLKNLALKAVKFVLDKEESKDGSGNPGDGG
jgi:hypothetical protein